MTTARYKYNKYINHLIDRLKPHSNGPLYSNMVIGTLNTDSWWVGCGIWYTDEGLQSRPVPSWLAVWLSGNALASINVVALRQTRLVPGRVTVCGRVNQPAN